MVTGLSNIMADSLSVTDLYQYSDTSRQAIEQAGSDIC
jgi:hypothetical protein